MLPDICLYRLLSGPPCTGLWGNVFTVCSSINPSSETHAWLRLITSSASSQVTGLLVVLASLLWLLRHAIEVLYLYF